MIGLFARFRKPPKTAIDPVLWAKIIARLPFLAALPLAEANALKNLAEEFLASKEFTAAGGLELSDDICVSIAAQGCLPILNLGLKAYRDWVGIIVYPDEFVVTREIEDESGVVHTYDEALSGEAWEGGPLIVSWCDAQMAGSGYNVVIHEFAHKLDMLNGAADGMPALHPDCREEAWLPVFSAAYEDFCRRVENAEETGIDPYASEHPAEFFAVLSEAFFELPALVDRQYPALYALLKAYYRQDPLSRATKAAIAASTAAS
jgi:Mlc titration factor MtfA (ptsG expression regulator)